MRLKPEVGFGEARKPPQVAQQRAPDLREDGKGAGAKALDSPQAREGGKHDHKRGARGSRRGIGAGSRRRSDTPGDGEDKA